MLRCPTSDELQQFLSGELQPEQETVTAAHFDHCERCQRLAEALLNEGLQKSTRATIASATTESELDEQPDVVILDSLHRLATPLIEDQRGLSHLTLPETIGDYRTLRLLAPGSTSTVYLATRALDTRVPPDPRDLVAIKVLAPECVARPLHRKRFERERNALVELPAHPNVVRVLDSCLTDETRYLVMDYAGGRNLWQLVVAQPEMTVEDACRLTLQVATGLRHIHLHGLIHRDIKPSNLIVDDQGRLKIVDFGIVHHAEVEQPESRLTEPNMLIGTADFMAPEQAVDVRNVGPPADIYSLGCTLAWLLTGQLVFEEKTVPEMLTAHRQTPAPLLRERRAAIPQPLDHLFQRMLAKLPEARPDSGEVIAELTAILSELTSPQMTGAPNCQSSILSRTTAEPDRLTSVLMALLAAAVLTIVAMLALAVR
jgi:serine/threonine protein kinase